MPLKANSDNPGRKPPTSAALSPWALFGAALLANGVLARGAAADGLVVNDLGLARQFAQAGGASSNGLSAIIPPPAGPAPGRFPLADQYRLKGWVIFLPGAADTLDQGLFGVRNKLADNGISYLGIESTFFADNLLHHGHPVGNSRSNQQYLGQLPSYVSQTFGYVNYDLSRYGVPDGQITVGGVLTSTNWDPAGPNKIALTTASYYQTLFDKKVEIKFGYLSNTLEFLGTQVGGSLAGGVFGPSSALFIEQGESASGLTTPGVNVKINLPQHLYTKLGIARALSPDGTVVETIQNRSAVRFKVANSGVWAIDEFGYKVNASPGQMQTWVRGAVTGTTSRYIDQLNTGTRHEGSYGLFLLGDHQFLQFAPNEGPGSAVRGLYAGASAEYAPPAANRFSQYYEARIYAFGPIPGRPFDLTSLVFTENVFSHDAVMAAKLRRQRTHNDTQALTASYSAHVLPGLNLNTAFTYTSNPTSVAYTGSTGSALNILTGLFAFF